MAIAPRRSRRRPYGPLSLLTLLIGGLGWILYLRVTGQALRDPFGLYTPAPMPVVAASPVTGPTIQPPAEGKVRVLISSRPIEAYARVTRDDLFDNRRGAFSFIDLDEAFVGENGVLVGTSGIVGRVMARAKRPGFAFTEADFLPKGTRPGLAAGIPPGKRALRIDVELVRGIIGLNPGDRFDLVAARELEAPRPAATISRAGEGPDFSGVYSELIQKDRDRQGAASTKSTERRARVDVIVQNGVVVSPIETRFIPTSSSSLTAGQVSGTRPVQEMIIALAPSEVAPLMAAMRLEADLTCVARSGHPDDPAESLTPGLLADEDSEGDEPDDEPEGPSVLPAGYEDLDMTVIETIVGGERVLTPVPRARGEEDPER